jgi:hypothetical protein
MEDKNIPEEITLQSLLQKANVELLLYERTLELLKSGIGINLQRQLYEIWINQYNPKILQTWRANMDLQFITDPYSCIMYITSYMMKSERAMSELLKKVTSLYKCIKSFFTCSTYVVFCCGSLTSFHHQLL